MIRYMFNRKILPLILLTLAFFYSIANVGYAKMLELITNTSIGSSGITFNTLVLLVILYLIFSFLINFLFSYYKKWYRISIMKDVRDDLYKSILKNSIYDFESHNKDFYLSKFTNDLNQLEEDYFGNIMYASGLILNLILAILFTTYMNWKITIAIIILSLPSLIVPFIGKNSLRKLKSPVLLSLQKATTTINDSLRAFNVIKFNLAGPNFYKKFSKETNDIKKSSNKEAQLQYLISALSDLFGNLMYIGSWVVGTYFVISHKISLGQLVALSQLVVFITIPLGEITPVLTEMFGGLKVAHGINKLIYSSKKHQKTNGNSTLNSIKYVNLTAKVDNNIILRDINLTIPYDKKVIVVGESGAGKSSLVNVIIGKLAVTSGYFKVSNKNNTPINGIDFNKFSILPQSSVIINDNLLENVRLYNKDISKEKVVQSLITVGLNKLVKNIDEPMKNIENKLSGGEKRRLDLARMILYKKKYNIFDEPTSGLDPHNAEIIENFILQMFQGFFMITHHFNINLFKNVDCIVVVKKGEILTSGHFNDENVKKALKELQLLKESDENGFN